MECPEFTGQVVTEIGNHSQFAIPHQGVHGSLADDAAVFRMAHHYLQMRTRAILQEQFSLMVKAQTETR